MNITFLIGNGFDLNLGLNTGYKSFYNYYIKKEPNDNLARSINNDYKLWSDLELGLGEYLIDINTDEDIEDFLDEKERLEQHLINYLSLQQSRVVYKNEKVLAESFKENVTNFFSGFSPKEKQHYKSVINGAREIFYQFIDFNYTDTLDRIIDITANSCKPFSKHISGNTGYNDSLMKPIHIHGDLNQNLILGLNDISQIKNEKLQGNINITDFILKPKLNEDIGYYKIRDAQKIIENSGYICIFGMSIGDTDNMWWQSILKWLLLNQDRRIILYVKDDTIISKSASAQMRYSKNKRKILSEHGINLSDDDYNKINSQVIIVSNSDIFNLKGIGIKYENEKSTNNDKYSNAVDTITTIQKSGINIADISKQANIAVNALK